MKEPCGISSSRGHDQAGQGWPHLGFAGSVDEAAAIAEGLREPVLGCEGWQVRLGDTAHRWRAGRCLETDERKLKPEKKAELADKRDKLEKALKEVKEMLEPVKVG